jgi:hypothetical protein
LDRPLTPTTSGSPEAQTAQSRRIRLTLVVSGTLIILITAGAGRLGMRTGAGLGPTRVQVGAAGLLLLIAGALRKPSRFLAGVIQRARTAGPVVFEPLTRRQRLQLCAVIVTAFTFRVWMIAAYFPTAQLTMGMSLEDAEMARNLLLGRGWVLNREFVDRVDRAIVERHHMVDPQDFFPVDDSKPEALVPFQNYVPTPGYSVWLASSFALGGAHRFIYSQWMQAALDSCGCLLVFGIARRLWSVTAGLVGALSYALSPAHVYLTIQTIAAATQSFWVLLVGYGIVRTWWDLARGRPTLLGTLFVALGAAAGALMNSSPFILPVAAAMWAALLGYWSRTARQTIGYMLVAQCVVVLLLVPWGLRNRHVYGQFTFLRDSSWQLIWEAMGERPNPWGLGVRNNDVVYWNWVRANCPAPCPSAERERITRHYLMTHVFVSPQFPGHLLRLVAHRLPALVYVVRLPADNPYPRNGLVNEGVGLVLRGLDILALLIGPAAAIGLLLASVRGASSAGAWLGLAPTLFFIVFSLLVIIGHRETTPAYGYLIALSGIAGAAAMEHRAEND